ncbi:MAG: hypothetical protein ACEY3D_06840 [Rickettsia sp.]|uniref:hypothetical protein n=1 Tax=Rickettsia sp. TaxID=789 RepID=UPI00397C0A7E
MSFPWKRESSIKRDKSSFKKSFKVLDSRFRGNDINGLTTLVKPRDDTYFLNH